MCKSSYHQSTLSIFHLRPSFRKIRYKSGMSLRYGRDGAHPVRHKLFLDELLSSSNVSTCVETSELLSFLTRWFVETYQWITASPLYVFGIVNF